MKKRFSLEFDIEDPATLTYETTDPSSERLEVSSEGETCVLYVNRGAARVFAEIFGKLALGEYKAGFHLHIPRNFDHDESRETLRIVYLA